MIRSYSETIDYYRQLRNLCYQHTLNEHKNSLSAFTLDEISFGAAQMADGWKKTTENVYREHRSKWSWVVMCNNYCNQPKRFDIAVWQGGQLCGLSYGVPTKRKTKLRLELIEASPLTNNPLRRQITTIITSSAINYAMLLGANELRMMSPANEKVVKYYKSFGYKPVRNRLGLTEYTSLELEY